MPKVKKIQMPNGTQLDLGVNYDWIGTKAEYDALGTYNDDWFYCVTDDTNLTSWIPELNEAKAEALEEVRKSANFKGWNIFDTKWSDHIINDIQWLRADTFSWQDGNVYSTVYNKLVEEYATGNTEVENDITFKKTSGMFKIALTNQEDNILNKFNADGIAWYYILDTTNKRFKLPRIKHRHVIEKGGDSLNGYRIWSDGFCEQWGWKNTDATTTSITFYKSYATRTYQVKLTNSIASNSYAPSVKHREVNYMQIFVNSTDYDVFWEVSGYLPENYISQTVGLYNYLYFYVGEYAQTAIEQTAGITSEQLNSKVDKTDLIEANTIIDSFIDGTEGYRIWSDGYCEQWGQGTFGSGGYDIVLPKKYKDTNYNVVSTFFNMSTAYGTGGCTGTLIAKKSENTIYIDQQSNASRTTLWRTYGYLAKGQY